MTVNVLERLEWRGLVHDVSDRAGLESLEAGSAFYIGFDPTAPSLQIGNLVPLIVSAHLAQAGLTPIVLFGGATGAIGDPSGKNEERQLLEPEELARNIENQRRKTEEILARVGVKPRFVNNLDWIGDVNVLTFLRDVGKHFTVNYMLAKDVVKSRLGGSGISFTEFSYMLLQAFDFAHLFREANCKLQIGGSDQWGNITAGLEYIRRRQLGEAYAFSWPLLTDSQGKKFGKSERGAIWLDDRYTSAYRLHQFWLNVDDRDAVRYLKIFTFLDQSEIAELDRQMQAAPESRVAQKRLADEVCTLVHGEAATADAKKSAEVLFGGSLEGLSEGRLEEIFAEVPSSAIPRSKLSQSTALDLFAESGIVASRGDGKRLFKDGGAYLNNERISDPNLMVPETGLLDRNLFVLRAGKKRYHVIKVVDG